MLKISLLAAAGMAALAFAPAPASAAPLHLTPALGAQSADSNVIEVQGRRHWRGGHRGYRGRDALIGLGVGAAIGGMIAAQPRYGYYDYGPPVAYGGGPYAYSGGGWEQCAAQFRSLRPDGTYTTYDGRQVMCPYLR